METAMERSRAIKYWFGLAIVVTAILVVAFGGAPNDATFRLETADVVTKTLLGLFVASLFMERAQEVFMTAWRGKESELLALEISRLETINKSNPTDTTQAELEGLKAQLTAYKATTRNIALCLGIFLGFLFALAGVRALAQIVDYENIQGVQALLFHAFDLVLTAGIIGGGSDALHKLISIFTDSFDSTRTRLKQSATQS